eukprot:6212813-Pleurochrysis_carterae.AAC.1
MLFTHPPNAVPFWLRLRPRARRARRGRTHGRPEAPTRDELPYLPMPPLVSCRCPESTRRGTTVW